MSLSPPAVASIPLLWKSTEKTGSLPCHMIWSVLTFMPDTSNAFSAKLTQLSHTSRAPYRFSKRRGEGDNIPCMDPSMAHSTDVLTTYTRSCCSHLNP